MKTGNLSEFRPHLTPLECGIIFDGIPEGAISRKVGLIWGIPANYRDSPLLQRPRHGGAMDKRGKVRPELDEVVLPQVRGQSGQAGAVHHGL